jgi:hypothetical protein
MHQSNISPKGASHWSFRQFPSRQSLNKEYHAQSKPWASKAQASMRTPNRNIRITRILIYSLLVQFDIRQALIFDTNFASVKFQFSPSPFGFQNAGSDFVGNMGGNSAFPATGKGSQSFHQPFHRQLSIFGLGSVLGSDHGDSGGDMPDPDRSFPLVLPLSTRSGRPVKSLLKVVRRDSEITGMTKRCHNINEEMRCCYGFDKTAVIW